VNSAATIGTYYFFGGMLQVIGSILEWFIENIFPFVVFGSLGKHLAQYNRASFHLIFLCSGAFRLAFGAPMYNAEGALTESVTPAAEKAAGVAQFQASLCMFEV
jgi:hypothetical protein